jgi:cysteine-rich repeat protein
VTTGELCDDGNAINGDNCDSNCTPTGCGNGIMTAGEVCDDGNMASWDGCTSTCAHELFTYIKSSNTAAMDGFSTAIAISADGLTLAVGATGEDSAATGIDGNQADNAASGSGALYVFRRTSESWVQQAYLKASNTNTSDIFGISVALSADGSTLAVGASGEDSAAAGIGGSQADNTAGNAGAVYVFTRTGATWTQQAYIKASNTGAGDAFGGTIALSGDGSTLAVGAAAEDSAAINFNGNQADNSADEAGAVYLFERTGATWAQRSYIKAPNAGALDRFGSKVKLSETGTLAVSSSGEASSATGVGGDLFNNMSLFAGAAYVLH